MKHITNTINESIVNEAKAAKPFLCHFEGKKFYTIIMAYDEKQAVELFDETYQTKFKTEGEELIVVELDNLIKDTKPFGVVVDTDTTIKKGGKIYNL
jgi:hypothetical protein